MRRFREAVAEYRQVLAAKPGQPEVLSNLAWLLATCPDSAVRNGTDAVRFAEQACRLTGYQRAQISERWRRLMPRPGGFTEAVGQRKRSIDLARAGGDARFAAVWQLLALYRSGKPYHMPAATPVRPSSQ